MPYYDIILTGTRKEEDKLLIHRNVDACIALGDRVLFDGTSYRVYNIIHDLGRNVSQLFVIR